MCTDPAGSCGIQSGSCKRLIGLAEADCGCNVRCLEE